MGEDRAYSHELAEKDFNYSPIPFEKGIEIEIEGGYKNKKTKLNQK